MECNFFIIIDLGFNTNPKNGRVKGLKVVSLDRTYLSKISELEDYTIMGIVDLREEKGFSSEVKFETLNHEGGMKVRVLEIAEKETFENCEGVWVKVLLTSPMWVSNKEWIEKYNKFWIFLTENTLIYSMER